MIGVVVFGRIKIQATELQGVFIVLYTCYWVYQGSFFVINIPNVGRYINICFMSASFTKRLSPQGKGSGKSRFGILLWSKCKEQWYSIIQGWSNYIQSNTIPVTFCKLKIISSRLAYYVSLNNMIFTIYSMAHFWINDYNTQDIMKNKINRTRSLKWVSEEWKIWKKNTK